MKSDRYYLGIDGGASKSEAALLAQDGTFLDMIRGDGVFIGAVVSKKQAGTLTALIDEVCKKHKISKEQIAGYGFGLCGYDYPAQYAQQKRSLDKKLGIPAEISTLVNDGIGALWGGANSARALVLQIGTGYTAAYRSRFGGEVPFDQVNCGVVVNLRKSIYLAAARVWDGRERDSILPALLMDYFDCHDPLILIQKLRTFHYSKEKVSRVLPVLNRAVAEKDAVATGLIENTAAEYAHDILTLIGKIGGKGQVEVVLGGGVLLHGPAMLIRRIRELVKEKGANARVHTPYLPPAVGGAVMAAFHDGRPIGKFLARAKKSFRK